MLKKQLLNISALCVLTAASSAAMAHLNIAQENVFAVGENGREYVEGSSAFLNVNISHDCSNANGEHFATTGVTMVLPNGESVEGGFTHSHATHEDFGANAMMSIKQRANQTMEKNIVIRGPVAEYYNHGLRTDDVRALQWLDGYVDNDHYDNLEIKTSFPKIDPASCVAKIKIYLPSVQYCEDDYKTAWIGTSGSKYGTEISPIDAKTRVTDRYAASISVVRASTNPLPAICNGIGDTVEARPSDTDIDTYLDPVEDKKGKKKK